MNRVIFFARRGSRFRWLVVAVALALPGFPRVGWLGAAEPLSVDFNRDVRPILAENCYHCHGNDADHRMAGLRLDRRAEAVEHGAIVPGEPEASELVERVGSLDPDTVMPPPEANKQLSEREKEVLRRWVAQGADYDPHWAFTPPQRPEIPAGSSVHPIDRFIESALQREGLAFSPPASPETLLRRVSLDLTGLPPSPAEVDAFLEAWRHDAEEAYTEAVDRLLSSQHYGERWGRWWLDQARYADSHGYSIDAPREMWKFRDWVIDALNQDQPFDQFTVEQLAGDLLPGATTSQQVATGFHRNTQINQEGGIDREQFRIDSVFDRVATTGTVWLGLSIGCAQCHDHKFDPIAQREYYQFFAFFNNQDEPKIKVFGDDVDPQALRREQAELQARIAEQLDRDAERVAAWEAGLDEAERAGFDKPLRSILKLEVSKRNWKQRGTLFSASGLASEAFPGWQARYDEIEAILQAAPTTLVLKERRQPRQTRVFIKGDFTRPDEAVQPGTPAILHEMSATEDRATRLDLARWIVDQDNPLTARVIMNRVWQQYFGRGIVETENDFGFQGTAPSHPELLDWLAVEFQSQGWSLKQMHRQIVLSRTYRQSSHVTDERKLRDPTNYWWGRQSRLRLDAEIVRDVALSASGLLASRIGGPSVFPPIPDGVMGQGQVKRAWRVSQGADKYRRGMYTFVYRGSPPPALNVFDAPEGLSSCTRRSRSNTPLQSLTLMNDLGFFEFAEALAEIIREDGLEVAFRRCTSRLATDRELEVFRALEPLEAARVMLNLDETVTRE